MFIPDCFCNIKSNLERQRREALDGIGGGWLRVEEEIRRVLFPRRTLVPSYTVRAYVHPHTLRPKPAHT